MRALFARVSKNRSQFILPLNASAAAADSHKPAVYCVHSISGAGGTDFIPLAKHLGEEVRVFGVQAPSGRIHDPAFGASVVSLAALYASVIAAASPTGALVLAGWSAGAVIALEIAHQLRALGREVSLVVAFDGAPEHPRAGWRRWDPRYVLTVLSRLPRWWCDMRAMEKRFQASAWRRVSAALGLVRDPQQAELRGAVDLDRYPPAQQQFMARMVAAIQTYAPRPWNGPVLVYEAAITPALRLPQHFAQWRAVAPQARAVTLDGNHYTIMREPRVAALGRDLLAQIAASAAPSPTSSDG